MSETGTEKDVMMMDKERYRGITEMQCCVFCMAQEKWGVTPKECSEIFKKYELLEFISECYDLLCCASYKSALADVEKILRYNGINTT